MAMLLTSRRRSSWTDRDHLRAALDGLPVCAIVCDLDLTVVHASDLARTSWPRWCDPGRHAAAPAATAGAPLLPQPMERPMPQPMEGPMQQPMPQQADPIGVRLTQLHGDPDEVRRVCAAAATEPQRLTLTVGARPLEATIGPARVATGGVAGGVAGGVIGYVIVLADPAERRADLSGARQAGARVHASVDQVGRLGADVESAAGAVTAHSDRLSGGVEELITLMSSVADGADLIRSSTLAVVDSAHSATVSVTELHDASARIGEFTALITSIAEQTKLLALNATIEATRAGAAGSGFAVVAKEVKDLAQRSRNATEEVSAIIEAIQAGSRAAGTALDTIVERVDVVGEQQLTVNAIVDKQVAQVDEIATIAQGLSDSVGGLNGRVAVTRESLTSLAERTDALDEELRAAAE